MPLVKSHRASMVQCGVYVCVYLSAGYRYDQSGFALGPRERVTACGFIADLVSEFEVWCSSSADGCKLTF